MALRDSLRRIGRALLAPRPPMRPARSRSAPTRSTPNRVGRNRFGSPPRSATAPRSPYPGDFTGTSTATYAPHPDGLPDPGEVVWAWVPYEEDHTQGKDRPVLVVGRDADQLLALMLTSKDHDRDAGRQAWAGRRWLDLGAGAWDRQGRPSEVRLDRVLRLEPSNVRREGSVLDRVRFEQVAERLRQDQDWTWAVPFGRSAGRW